MKKYSICLLTLIFALLLSGCPVDLELYGPDFGQAPVSAAPVQSPAAEDGVLTLDDVDIADFLTDQPFVELYNNEPQFTAAEITADPFETYADLDELGRCGVAYANICQEIMPTEPRGSISQVKPTGWHSVQYDNVDGKSLYNRCHLIGFQLAGEDANWQNLITGTRYLNVVGMLPFENLVADYVKETNNHVLYRVTPLFLGDDLVAIGVQMEGYSVEDNGDGVCFNVFCYNAQPGIGIDYATGESWLDDSVGTGTGTAGSPAPAESQETPPAETQPVETQTEEVLTYVLNTNSRKFHLPDCSGASQISEANRQNYTGTRSELIAQGYEPCGICKP